ncbi:TetR/AcrR family transcriptional regulator, partial [Agrobacterium pusense]
MAKTKLSRAEQKIQRPLQILDAAFEEFTKRGFTATRVEDIADRVGVTKGTVYVYFETKEALFAAMIEHVGRPFQEAFEAYERTSDDRVEE